MIAWEWVIIGGTILGSMFLNLFLWVLKIFLKCLRDFVKTVRPMELLSFFSAFLFRNGHH